MRVVYWAALTTARAIRLRREESSDSFESAAEACDTVAATPGCREPGTLPDIVVSAIGESS